MAKKAAKKRPASKKSSSQAPPKAAATPSQRPPPPAPPRDNLDLLEDVPLTLTVELGRHRDTMERVLDYGEHTLVELDRSVGDAVDIRLNGRLFARGEVVTASENFGVRITEIVEQPG